MKKVIEITDDQLESFVLFYIYITNPICNKLSHEIIKFIKKIDENIIIKNLNLK